MSHILGCYEPFESIEITFFNGALAQYFVAFFIDHPVHTETQTLGVLKSLDRMISRLKIYRDSTFYQGFIERRKTLKWLHTIQCC